MRHIRFAPRTLAARILLVLVFGALLPLALVGTWLTRSAERSGMALLTQQLSNAADVLQQGAQEAWTLRQGDLQLLTNNTAAHALLSSPAPIGRIDSIYLHQLEQSLAGRISLFSYRDAIGSARWTFKVPEEQDFSLLRDAGRAAQAKQQAETIVMELPIVADGGRRLGTLIAGVRVAGFLPDDAARAVFPGATLAVADTIRTLSVSDAGKPDLFAPDLGSDWAVARRNIAGSPLRLALAAPTAPYTRPFAHAARVGVGLLISVAFIALTATLIFTRRITRSLEQLATAAGAVAAGDLQRTVPAASDDEIGRVAVSFNVMTESLRRTMSELAQQRALAAVGEFAASLSHEIRNALTAVRVDLQHAKRHLPVDNMGTTLVTRTLDTVRRLDSTVTGALSVARSRQSRAARLNLLAVLQHAMHGAKPSFDDRGALLEPLGRVTALEIDGDGAGLEQLFLNLLFNSAQALGAGGRARIEIEESDACVTVKVIDNGIGIAPSELSVSGMPLRSTKPDGSGLGLPIARRIAIAHGGDLQVESILGRGTTVIVTLPRGLRAEAPSGALVAAEPSL